MSEHSLQISKVVWEKAAFNRMPTQEEILLIEEGQFYSVAEDLINWDEAEVIEEDYSYGQITLTINGKRVFHRKGYHLIA